MRERKMTGLPSIDKPWLKYYTEEAINAPLPECTAYELLYQNNKEHLNDIALNYYDRQFTYGQLFKGIEEAAKGFTALGIQKGDVVIVCTVNMPETVYTLYALDRIGAITNLVDPRTNEEQLRHYINECSAKLVMTVDLAYPIIKKAVKGSTVEKILVVSPADSLSAVKRFVYRLKNKAPALENNAICWKDFVVNGMGVSAIYASYEKGRCFVIAHTGGTTGIPKGVMISDDNINAVTHGYRYLGIPFERQHTYFNDLPPFIIYGLAISVHTALCYGQRVILYSAFDSKGFPKLFAKYKPNHFSALTDHLKYLASNPVTKNMDLSFLISPGVGGDSLNEAIEREVNAYLKRNGCRYEVIKGYGMTELSATSIISFDGANAVGSIGIPLVNNTVKIVDVDTGNELGYDETGEIWLSGPSAMIGYYHNPEATAEVLIEGDGGEKWVRTGDLGRINKDGLVFHEGRIRRIYLTAFEGQPAKIFPMLVENAVKEHQAVYDCTVVARLMRDSAYYEPVAYVILKDTGKTEYAVVGELKAICAHRLPTYMQPVEYRFVQDFPHTPIGKVDFRTLERMAAEQEKAK